MSIQGHTPARSTSCLYCDNQCLWAVGPGIKRTQKRSRTYFIWGVIAAKIGYFHLEGVISNAGVDLFLCAVEFQLISCWKYSYILAKNILLQCIAKI